MAVFPSFNLTKKGEELLNRSIGEGRVLTFTKFKIGDGVPTGDWRDLDNLQSSFKEFPVLETAIQADQVLRIRGYFDNKGFATDKQFKEIGVFVTLDGVAGEHLYSYTNAGDTGDIIPAESRGFYSRTLDVNNYIGYATNITFNIEQTRDNFDFNTENELKVATFLKKGDKVKLWGKLVLGDTGTKNGIIVQEKSDLELMNGLYFKIIYEEATNEEVSIAFDTIWTGGGGGSPELPDGYIEVTTNDIDSIFTNRRSKIKK
ncbi:MAG: hypothetical protein ACRCZO_18905 [Cetobacterium sp.]